MWVILPKLGSSDVCRLIWTKQDLFFGIFKGENDSQRNLKGFMSRKSKEMRSGLKIRSDELK